jgi:1-acyl-sn-glycerol-3-phosphate acyltransferase
MVAGWTHLMVKSLHFFCGINYKIEGLENIPKDRPGVILSKHQSTWETLFLPTLFPSVAIIVKKELMWLPFFGWGLLAVEPIAIDRRDRVSAIEQIFKKGKEALDQGRWILVFPEGTRVSPGVVGTYRQGGARLAVHAGYPVIPVAHNAGRYWPKRKFMKKPGTIRVAIGPLIETKDRAPDAVLTEAKNWIETTVLRIDQPIT